MAVALAVGVDRGPDLPAGANALEDLLADHAVKDLPLVMVALVNAVAAVAPTMATPCSVRPVIPWTIPLLRGASSRLGTCPKRRFPSPRAGVNARGRLLAKRSMVQASPA
jgi:hypothetical protein